MRKSTMMLNKGCRINTCIRQPGELFYTVYKPFHLGIVQSVINSAFDINKNRFLVKSTAIYKVLLPPDYLT